MLLIKRQNKGRDFMELVKDIYFNTDKLIENTKVKVSYTGKFYQGNNDKVFLHYGYGSNWNNVNEIEMAKTDLGYQAELDLLAVADIECCRNVSVTVACYEICIKVAS